MTLTQRAQLAGRSRVFPYLVLPALVGGLAVVPVGDGPTACPFANVTGHACPLCGGTRAAASLVRGDMGAALAFHPLIPLVAVAVVVAWVRWIGVREGRYAPLSPTIVNRIVWISIALFTAVWTLRAATGTLPPV